jgi:hypothetical protein
MFTCCMVLPVGPFAGGTFRSDSIPFSTASTGLTGQPANLFYRIWVKQLLAEQSVVADIRLAAF